MPIYYDPEKLNDYVLEDDRELDKSKQAIFHFKPPTIRDRDSLFQKLFAVRGKNGKFTAQSLMGAGLLSDTLRMTLRGWKNWVGPDGEAVPFKTTKRGEPDDLTLARLIPRYQIELATEALSMLDSEERERD